MNAKQIKEAVTKRLFPHYDPTITFGDLVRLATIGLATVSAGYYVVMGLRDGEAARTKYIPIIEKHEANISLMNQRLDNFTEAFFQIRLQLQEHQKELGEHESRLSVIEAKRGANGLRSPN